ncbi:MAG TPA: hypothetical protein VHR97_07740 [Candidatus Baltobacteraceae bacterium]|jgi:hypothetical protein|nr:hypothetical protein [Candidatus Baltobacteraceae bacterium]
MNASRALVRFACRKRRAGPLNDPIPGLDPTFVELPGVAVTHRLRDGFYLAEIGSTVRNVSARPRQCVLEVVLKEETHATGALPVGRPRRR